MSDSELSEWASEDDVPLLERPIFKSKTAESKWERKQRDREYRVASRREKRYRKSDEKKQRQLNAAILRRLTKNPEKYNKNADQNRRREIEMERRKIYEHAVSQAERLAAIHDPSGRMFNVGPVVIQDGGKVVSAARLEQRAHIQAERAAKHAQRNQTEGAHLPLATEAESSGASVKTKNMNKNQRKKQAIFEKFPQPPKPVLPDWVQIPEGEDNWIALWDLSEDELELRVIREKKRKAAERKVLREKQKAGKAERRAARDERRRVYREKKLEWEAIKKMEKQQKTKLLRVEQEEAKRVEKELDLAGRRKVLEICARLGFTLENVEGLDQIQPKARGMKRQEVDFGILEIGDRPSELRIKGGEKGRAPNQQTSKGSRINLGRVIEESKTKILTSDGASLAGLDEDFIALDFGGGYQDERQLESLNYNHKVRRKLHRAIEAAEIQKEQLVRSKAKDYCESEGIPVPPELAVDYKPIKITGRRILEDGTVETEKQERVRKRLELAAYNKAAKVLRQQAKAEAIEAGLRVFAELTGKDTIDGEGIASSTDVDHLISATVVDGDAKKRMASQSQLSRKHRRHGADSETEKSKKLKTASSQGPPAVTKANYIEVRPASENNHRGLDSTIVESADPALLANSGDRKAKAKTIKKKASGAVLGITALEGEAGVIREDRKKGKGSKQENDLDEELASDTVNHVLVLGPNSKKPKRSSLINSTPTDDDEKAVKKRKITREGNRVVIRTDQWTPAALMGDTARKDKFLRLLGGKKVNNRGMHTTYAKPASNNFTLIENDLERQFEAGVRMKYSSLAKGGLGA